MSEPQKNRTLKRLSIAVAFVVVVLIVLPIAVKYGAIYGLKEAGASEVAIDDVDLNLFTGTLAVRGLQVGGDQEADLQLSYVQVDVAYLPLFKKRFLLESVQLEAVRLNIREQQGQLHIVVPIPASEAEVNEEPMKGDDSAPWGIGVSNVQLRDVDVNIDVKNVTSKARVAKLDVSELYSWAPSDVSTLLLEGDVNGAALNINGNVQPFSEIPEYKTHLKIDALSLAPLAPFLKNYVQAYDVSVSLDTDLRIVMTKEGSVEVSQQGGFDVEVGKLVREDVELENSNVGWEGEVRLELPVGENPLVKAEGKLFGRALNAVSPELEMGVKHEGVTWQGAVSIDAGDVENSIQAKGALKLSNLVVLDHKESINPLAMEQFELGEVFVAGINDVDLGQINIQSLKVLSVPSSTLSPVLSLGDITVQNLLVKKQNDIAIDSVVLNGLAAKITVLENGELDVITAYIETVNKRLNPEVEKGASVANGVSGEAGKKPGQSTSPDSEGARLHFVLKEFRVDGENRIQFSDHSVTPHYNERVYIDKAIVGPLDTNQSSELTPVDVALRIGEFSTVTLNGALAPLQEKIQGALELVVKGVELTSVSSYAEKATGYAIGSGQFNLDTSVSLANGQMKVDNEVFLKQLVLTPVNEELVASVSKQFSMPIGVSLGLLKDSDGNIRLSVPLEGDLNDPSVNIAYVIRLAMVQAIKKGSVSYLKYAIQPYGAIILVGEAVGEMVMEVTVAPLEFVAQSSEMGEADLRNLPKLAVLLNSLPDKSITLCPIITELDNPLEGGELKMNDDLKALAISRLAKAKALLVSDHAIAPERILFCRAKVGEGKPRIELDI